MPSAPESFIRPDWAAPPGVRALCTVRQGGVSIAPYDSMNLGVHVGDDLSAVATNRRRLVEAAALPASPRWLQQVHGIAVADLDVLPPGDTPPMADAAVTRHPGTVCALLTADCLPVLLARRDGSAVGAAHAGWRGLAGGVVAATVEALATPGRDLVAWLGPAIGPEHFEVGGEVREAFLARLGTAADGAFAPNRRGRWQCDLYALARMELARLGIDAVAGGGFCTFADAPRFFSHRRDGARTGRMATLVWIERL